MKVEHKEIIDLLSSFLEQDGVEHLRFGQVLHILGVNEFVNPDNPELWNHQLRDIFNDSDGRIINRIKNSLTIINK